jgi:hypothetical protein
MCLVGGRPDSSIRCSPPSVVCVVVSVSSRRDASSGSSGSCAARVGLGHTDGDDDVAINNDDDHGDGAKDHDSVARFFLEPTCNPTGTSREP